MQVECELLWEQLFLAHTLFLTIGFCAPKLHQQDALRAIFQRTFRGSQPIWNVPTMTTGLEAISESVHNAVVYIGIQWPQVVLADEPTFLLTLPRPLAVCKEYEVNICQKGSKVPAEEQTWGGLRFQMLSFRSSIILPLMRRSIAYCVCQITQKINLQLSDYQLDQCRVLQEEW